MQASLFIMFYKHLSFFNILFTVMFLLRSFFECYGDVMSKSFLVVCLLINSICASHDVYQNEQSVESIMAHASVQSSYVILDGDGRTPLMLAASKGDVDGVQKNM